MEQGSVGRYLQVPKCNFDVEIAVDAIRRMPAYDTLVLLSGDADFVSLIRYLKKKGKKVILIKAGHITAALRDAVDLVVNAQKVKKSITRVDREVATKQKPGKWPGFCEM